MTIYEISKAKALLKSLIDDGLVYGTDSDILGAVIEKISNPWNIPKINYHIDHSKHGFNMTCSACGCDIPEYAKYCPGCGGIVANAIRTAREEYRVARYIFDHDSEDLCRFCIYSDNCPKGVTGGPNGPIYPPCADGEVDDYLDYENLLEVLDGEGNLIEDNDVVAEMKFIMSKYLYQEDSPYTQACIDSDLRALAYRKSDQYHISFTGDIIFLGEAPVELLAILPYKEDNILMNKDYKVLRRIERGVVTYHGKCKSTNPGVMHIGYDTTYCTV